MVISVVRHDHYHTVMTARCQPAFGSGDGQSWVRPLASATDTTSRLSASSQRSTAPHPAATGTRPVPVTYQNPPAFSIAYVQTFSRAAGAMFSDRYRTPKTRIVPSGTFELSSLNFTSRTLSEHREKVRPSRTPERDGRTREESQRFSGARRTATWKCLYGLPAKRPFRIGFSPKYFTAMMSPTLGSFS